jgi:hypothetical protein
MREIPDSKVLGGDILKTFFSGTIFIAMEGGGATVRVSSALSKDLQDIL